MTGPQSIITPLWNPCLARWAVFKKCAGRWTRPTVERDVISTPTFRRCLQRRAQLNYDNFGSWIHCNSDQLRVYVDTGVYRWISGKSRIKQESLLLQWPDSSLIDRYRPHWWWWWWWWQGCWRGFYGDTAVVLRSNNRSSPIVHWRRSMSRRQHRFDCSLLCQPDSAFLMRCIVLLVENGPREMKVIGLRV